MHDDLEGQRLLIQLSKAGCVKTRRDAETMQREIEQKGWKEDLKALYRAVLYLLGDRRAIETLKGADKPLAMTAYNGMKKYYIGDKQCTCPAIQTTVAAVLAEDCPVHGQTVNQKMRLSGFDN